MRSIVNKLVLTTAFVATTFMTIAAEAQTMIKVPFNFTIANKMLPAGSYSLERAPHGGFVTMKSMYASETFTWIITPGEPNPSDSRVVLNFDEMGHTHVLQSIQYHSQVTSRLDGDVIHVKHGARLSTQGQ